MQCCQASPYRTALIPSARSFHPVLTGSGVSHRVSLAYPAAIARPSQFPFVNAELFL